MLNIDKVQNVYLACGATDLRKSIDGLILNVETQLKKNSYENALFGSEKALSIRNAIPIYNEAFDYAEQDSTNSDIAL